MIVHVRKLLLLLSVLLMPFAMQPAAATPMAGAMAMQHCPEQGSSHHGKGVFAECTMACSAALPAVELGTDRAPLLVGEPTAAAPAPALHGLHPETATPPPKDS